MQWGCAYTAWVNCLFYLWARRKLILTRSFVPLENIAPLWSSGGLFLIYGALDASKSPQLKTAGTWGCQTSLVWVNLSFFSPLGKNEQLTCAVGALPYCMGKLFFAQRWAFKGNVLQYAYVITFAKQTIVIHASAISDLEQVLC